MVPLSVQKPRGQTRGKGFYEMSMLQNIAKVVIKYPSWNNNQLKLLRLSIFFCVLTTNYTRTNFMSIMKFVPNSIVQWSHNKVNFWASFFAFEEIFILIPLLNRVHDIVKVLRYSEVSLSSPYHEPTHVFS